MQKGEKKIVRREGKWGEEAEEEKEDKRQKFFLSEEFFPFDDTRKKYSHNF
jgi:hypothetical protein